MPHGSSPAPSAEIAGAALPPPIEVRRGRPPKYATEEERRAARLEQQRRRNALKNTPPSRGRPPKYLTEEERRVAQLESQRRWRERQRAARMTADDRPRRGRPPVYASDEERRAPQRERARRLASTDARREYQRRWRTDNAEHVRAAARTYYERNQEEIRERKRIAYATEEERRTRRQQYRLARTASIPLPDDIAYAYLAAIADDPCTYCSAPGEESDHIVPLSARRLGAGVGKGTNDWWNFTRACSSCNSSKNDWPLATYLARSFADRRHLADEPSARAWLHTMHERFAWELATLPGCQPAKAHAAIIARAA